MRRSLAVAVATASLCLAGSGTALAGDEPPVAPAPPEFVPPPVVSVTDEASAESFLEGYASDNAGRFLGTNRHRVRVQSTDARCLQSPTVATRYGCVFRLRAFVINRLRGWDDWGHGARSARVASKRGGHGHGHRRFRVRRFGCLGLATVDAVDAAAPTVNVRFLQCARIPREDITVEEPAPVV